MLPLRRRRHGVKPQKRLLRKKIPWLWKRGADIINFNKISLINARCTRSLVATSHRFFCISSTTLPLPSSVLPRSGCAQVPRPCSSSWGSVCVLWATTFKVCRQQRDFAAGIGAPMFFGARSRSSHPSVSPPSLGFLVLADTP